MSDPSDIQRLVGDVCRIGTVASVDLAAATCCVRIGEILTNDLPWVAPRAGAARAWLPPSVGEQVVVLAAEGDTEAGIVLGGLFSDAQAAPSAQNVALLRFEDSAWFGYDPAAHHFAISLPASATAEIRASGGIKLVGDVTIEGKLTASGDVIGAGISLKEHVHGQVQAGGAKSGKPE